jgi:hypothetical protein
VLALDVLQKRERLTERAQGALDARLTVHLRRGKFGFEERADGFGNVLRDAQRFFGDVRVLLKRLQRRPERFTSLSYVARR